jgi:hypothetical protein
MVSAHLTPEQRARLRPSVDVAALERLLAAVPPESRLAVVTACVRTPTREDLLALGFDVPDLTEAPALMLGEQPDLRFLPEASYDAILHFDDPVLAALWAAVEPQADA